MAKRVSADTITEITAEPAFRGRQPAESPPPSTEELIKRVRQELADRTAARKKMLTAAGPDEDPERAATALRRATEDQQQFEQMIKEVPKGFRLVPVLYSRIEPQAKADLTQEYSFHVRPRFLKFLAENHAEELKELGICDAGVERMRQGLDPANEKGEPYSVNVDHIIERNGSGVWGAQKESDPDQPGFQPKYHPNHFGNFILLPEKIHAFKNSLNDLQHASETPLGQNKWILMMVPERNELHSGFVCPKQDPSHRLAGLDLRPLDDFKRVEHGEFIVTTALSSLAELKVMPGVAPLVRGQIVEADAAHATVADLAAEQAAGKKPGNLRKSFNEAVAKQPDVQAHLDNFVKPGLREVTGYVSGLYNQLSAKLSTRKERAAFWSFARFFRSQPVKDLQMDIEALPIEEASDMQRTFRQLAGNVTRVCDKLDADAKARRATEQRESIPDFHGDNQPRKAAEGQFLPRRKRAAKKGSNDNKADGSREKKTFGRPGHFKGKNRHR